MYLIIISHLFTLVKYTQLACSPFNTKILWNNVPHDVPRETFNPEIYDIKGCKFWHNIGS